MSTRQTSAAKYHALSTEDTDDWRPQKQTRWEMLWRATNGVMTVFFFLAAFVQINDEDFYLWIPVYLIPGFLSLSIVINPSASGNVIWNGVSLLHITLCSVGGAFLLLEIGRGLYTGEMSGFLEHEIGREIAGLFIIVSWLACCRTSKPASVELGNRTVKAWLVMSSILTLLPLVLWAFCFDTRLGKQFNHCKDMFPGMLGS